MAQYCNCVVRLKARLIVKFNKIFLVFSREKRVMSNTYVSLIILLAVVLRAAAAGTELVMDDFKRSSDDDDTCPDGAYATHCDASVEVK